jgi:hypothetical protein
MSTSHEVDDSLVDVALNSIRQLDNTQRQYELKRQKGSGKRATDRLEALWLSDKNLKKIWIKNMLTYMFKSVFVHRYRDTISRNHPFA